jgi:hypothetical protein
MKFVAEMGSGAMIYKPSFIYTGSVIQEFIGGIHRHTDIMVILQAFLYFLKIMKVGQKMV